MTPNEYAAQFEEIHQQLEALYEKITAPDYCDRVPRKDFQRDIAAALELGQRKQDLYAELLTDLEQNGTE